MASRDDVPGFFALFERDLVEDGDLEKLLRTRVETFLDEGSDSVINAGSEIDSYKWHGRKE
jgi:hypothetical protein